MPIGRVYSNRFDRYKGRIVRQHGEGNGGVFKGYPTKYGQRGKGIGAVVVPIAKQAALAAGGALLNAGKKYLKKKLSGGGRKKKGKGKGKRLGKGKGKGKGKKTKSFGAQLIKMAKARASKALSKYLGGDVPKKRKKIGGSRAAKVENRLTQIRKNNSKTLAKRKKQRGGGGGGGGGIFEVKRPPPFFGKWPDDRI